MFPLYLQYLLIDFRQTFVTGASWDTDELITFSGQKVKVQGHTIAAEAHSTRRYRRVQLFLVSPTLWPLSEALLFTQVNDRTDLATPELCKYGQLQTMNNIVSTFLVTEFQK